MEENKKKKLPIIGKLVLKILFGLILFIMLLLNVAYFAIRIPAVQTWVVRETSDLLSEKLQHQISIDQVKIRFFKSLVLNKVKVLDKKNKVLFYVGELDANISLFNVLSPNKLHLSNLTLTQPQANLVRYQGTDSLNLSSFMAAVNKLLRPKKPTTTKTTFEFKIDAVTLNNGRFTYDMQHQPYTEFGIDYQHMGFDSIYAKITQINLDDTLQLQLDDLRGTEIKTKTRLHQLDTRMTYAPTFWEFADLNLQLGRSNLAKYIRFDYRKFTNMQYFNDSVTVTGNLQETKLFSEDIAMFAPQIREMKENLLISGEVKGRVRRFNAKNIDARYGNFTRIVGNLSASGLPSIRETFLELNLKPSEVNAADLKKYIPKNSYAIAQRLGTIKLKGSFIGFLNDFVANGTFNTALGNVVSDINLKINNNTNASSYSGYLNTTSFELGKLIGNNKIVSTISLDGRVKGNGFDLATARLAVDANIKAINLYGYNYRNITTDATLSRELFSGSLIIRDPYINLEADGNVNISKTNPAFNFIADINLIDFKAVGLSKEAIKLTTKAKLDFKGLTLDEILGQGTFSNTTLAMNDKVLSLDSMFLVSALNNQQRLLQFKSELVDLNATGNWQYTTLIRDLQVLVQEYYLNFKSNNPEIATYYRKKPRYQNKYYSLDYLINLKNINPILQAFVPLVKIAHNTRIDGNFRQGDNAQFSINSYADTISYGKKVFYQNELELNTSKLPYNPDVLANAVISSQKQQLTTGGTTQDLYLEGVWSDRNILFNTNIAQTNTTNRANISGNLAFLANQIQVVFSSSNINVLGKEWAITPNNIIEIAGSGKEINFQNFVISHQNQQVSIAGMLSQDPSQELDVKLLNFRLENLNPLMTQKVNGTLNASIAVSNLYKQPIITSTLTADSVIMDNIFVGTIAGKTNWNNDQKYLEVDLGITRDRMKVLNVTGYYNPNSATQQIDLLAVMDEAPVKLVEPLLNTLLGDLSGTMQGRLKLTGKITAPILEGSALVTNGRFNFKYLNTVYTFTDRIYFTEHDITFKNVRLRDALNNTGTISGSIIHQGFKDMTLDLRGEFRKLMVLNTTRENNQLYFGTAIATGTATVLGSPSNLVINIDARSEAGTRMSIPLDNNSTVTRQNFIHFVNRNVSDTSSMPQVEIRNPVNLAGINMNFNLNITPDAYVEIILDQNTGDIVRGSGNGRIKMNIDTRGTFTMEGQIEITRGAYNFTLYNVINKEFIVRPGGTITWTGNPYEGVMDITATYTQTVPVPESFNLQALTNDGGPTPLIRIPVTAVMSLDGNLLTPEIRLDLEFNNTPSEYETQLSSLLANIRSDQDELNRQVFSLLILKRLSELNTFGSGGAGNDVTQGIASSLSELITNQLGNWLSQLDNNLEVDIGVQGADQLALQNLQVRLSYSLMEGRLRVSREGGIGNNSNSYNNSGYYNQNNLAGDWRLEYYIGRTGKLRLRMEFITSQRQFTTTNTSTTRASVLHTEQFDNLRELFARRRLRRKYQVQPKETIIMDSDPRFDDIR